jgi:hypothetical protein
MSIFKTDVAPGICCTTDQVVSSAVCTSKSMAELPGLEKAAQMDVQNTQRGAVRRMSGDK